MMNQLADQTKVLRVKELPTADTLENWEAIDPVIPLGKIIAVTNILGTDTRFKIGFGNRRFSETPWVAMTEVLETSFTSAPLEE